MGAGVGAAERLAVQATPPKPPGPGKKCDGKEHVFHGEGAIFILNPTSPLLLDQMGDEETVLN